MNNFKTSFSAVTLLSLWSNSSQVYANARELFFNIGTPSRAHHATLPVRKAGQHLRFSVQDDGSKTDTTRIGHEFGPTGGFGLFRIREQVEGIRGSLEIVPSPAAGTQVIVAVPKS
ncbi:MAG: signal transduction histidine kinase [Arenicella sp.]|jgi:signal transduction histidine kinase